MSQNNEEWREYFNKLPNDILLEIFAVSSLPSSHLDTIKKILINRGISDTDIDTEAQKRIKDIKLQQIKENKEAWYNQEYKHWPPEKRKEYKIIRALIWFGYVRIAIWAALTVTCYLNLSNSHWWLLGLIIFGVIFFADMLIVGFGAEYAIKGSGFENRARKNGLYK